MRRGQRGLQLRGAAQAGDGFRETRQGGQRQAVMKVVGRASRVLFDGGLGGGRGFLRPGDHDIGCRQIALEVGVAGSDGYGPLQQGDRFIAMTGLKRKRSEQVQGIRMIWLLGEDRAVDGLGRCELSGVVVFHASRQCVANGGHAGNLNGLHQFGCASASRCRFYGWPTAIRCDSVRRNMRPPATAGVARVVSPRVLRPNNLYSAAAARATTSPSSETQ